MKPRRVVLIGLVLVVVGGLAWALWRRPELWQALVGPGASSGRITVSGNIEAHESVLSFANVQAPIVLLPFDEGARVAAGTVLAKVDDRIYRRQVDIDQRNLEAAQAQVAVDEAAFAAARTNVTNDESDLAQRKLDFLRAEALLQAHTGTQVARDLAFTARARSEAALAHEQAMVNVAERTIALHKANAAAAEQKLKLDEVTLSYTALRAPFSGVIAVRQAELGELAGPGVAIFTLADLDHVWLRAYINEPDLGKVRLGEDVTVTTDTYAGKLYRGRISFISPTAEFTPKTVETHAERVTLVYRIRIDIDNPTHELLPGMPADASIRLLPSGT
jgi:membrane fusion protein YbhG